MSSDLDDVARHLGHLLAASDPCPDDVKDAARQAFAFARVHLEVAELIYDSALDDRPLAGVRGVLDRQLTFESPALAIDLQIVNGGRVLMGQVTPASNGTIEVRREAENIEIAVDDWGRFVMDKLPPGPLSLRWHRTATPWIDI